MSTRCNVEIINGDSRTILYRHHDGYLSMTGADLYFRTINARHSAGKLLVDLLTNHDEGHYELTTKIHGDIEHWYAIDFSGDAPVLKHASRPANLSWQEWSEAWCSGASMTPAEFASLVNGEIRETNVRIRGLNEKNGTDHDKLEEV